MSPIRLNGSTSGYSQIDAPATAGNNTLVLPGGNGTDAQVLSTNGSGTLSWVDRGRMVLETSKASTSGTFVDFTGIPSWVKRITVMFNGVSTNGASEITVRGGAGSYETSGYTGTTSSTPNNTLSTVTSWSTGATVIFSTGAASLYYGAITFSLLTSNTWSIVGALGRADTLQVALAGSKTFSGTLDRIRITTVNGTDTFDAGSINILYEG